MKEQHAELALLRAKVECMFVITGALLHETPTARQTLRKMVDRFEDATLFSSLYDDQMRVMIRTCLVAMLAGSEPLAPRVEQAADDETSKRPPD